MSRTLWTAALLASAGSFAADAPKDTDASVKTQQDAERARCAQYDADRARCASGSTGQDQASCLKSADAAYDSMRPSRHRDGLDANGRGAATEGSVDGGGIIGQAIAKTGPTLPSR